MSDRLQYISQGGTVHEQLKNIQYALDVGCTWIQLRFKQANEKDFKTVAEQVKAHCSRYKAIFIINDHVAVAEEIDSHGVHLGLEDMAVIEARRILSKDKIIGGTANTLEDVLKRVEEQCNYVGLGPYRFTTTKEKLSPILGVKGYGDIMRALDIRKIAIPVYAIGGILSSDIECVLRTGIYGVAVSGAVTNDSESKAWIQNFKLASDEHLLSHGKISNSR